MEFMKLNIQMFASNSLNISANECDISIVNNNSYINLTITATSNSTTYNTTGNAYVNATLTGQNNTYSIPKTNFKINKGSTVTVYSGKIGPFQHNTDGKLNPVTISASAYITSSTKPSATATCNMSTIARKSSVSATSGEIEGTTKITIARASSSFTHTLKYSFGNLTGTIATKTSNTSISWTIPTSFYAKISNAKKGTCTITCETYSGSALVGSSTCTFEASCNESKCKPTVMATVVDTNQDAVDLTGDGSKLIKYKSTAKITPTAASKNSSSISKITVDGVDVTSALNVSNVNRNTFTIVATDSRGFSTTLNKTVTMIDYVQLSCSCKVKRASQVSSKVTLNGSGNYYNGSFGTTNNTLSLSFSYKEKGTNDWISGGIITPTISSNTYTFEVQAPTDFDYKKAYEFIVYYTDKLDALSITQNLKKGIASLAVHEKGLKANDTVFLRWDNEDNETRLNQNLKIGESGKTLKDTLASIKVQKITGLSLNGGDNYQLDTSKNILFIQPLFAPSGSDFSGSNFIVPGSSWTYCFTGNSESDNSHYGVFVALNTYKVATISTFRHSGVKLTGFNVFYFE